MRTLKNYCLFSLFISLAVLVSCGKSGDVPVTSGNGGGGTPTGGNNNGDTSSVLRAISQVNSGKGAESSLVAEYNSNDDITKLILIDSTRQAKEWEANFNYVTRDSVRMNGYQYILLDNSKRVIRFVTKSDMSHPTGGDTYACNYTYNGEGYLVTKDLFINGSSKPNFTTTYTYTNGSLTSCIMTTPSSCNLKVLESTLSYNNSVAIKNWIYTIPDAMEGYQYLTILNFGKHGSHPVERVVTSIYDPPSGKLLDTWTTDYGNYNIDENGHVISGEATGDSQQGMAAFYGKTNFYYACH